MAEFGGQGIKEEGAAWSRSSRNPHKGPLEALSKLHMCRARIHKVWCIKIGFKWDSRGHTSGQPEWEDTAELLEHLINILESSCFRNRATLAIQFVILYTYSNKA